MFAELAEGGFACAHNGNLVNASSIRKSLIKNGAIFQSTSDTEIILQLVARSREKKIIDKLIDALSQIKGAYSLVILTNKKLIGVRDPYGIRPLVLGDLNGSPVLASETCAFDIIGAKYIRDVENGEIVNITKTGTHSVKPFPETKDAQPRIGPPWETTSKANGMSTAADISRRTSSRLLWLAGADATMSSCS